MGKSCVRFKKIEDVALNVIGQAIKRVPVKKFIANYESVLEARGMLPSKTSAKKSSAKKTAAKSARKSTSKRTAKAKKKTATRS